VRTSEERFIAIEDYLSRVFGSWLTVRRIGTEQAQSAVEDVGSRLSALTGRWENADELLPSSDRSSTSRSGTTPAEANVMVRAAVTLGVRNSELEDLHVKGLVAEADWRELTVAAAEHFAHWDFDLGAQEPVMALELDPFDGLRDVYPLSWAAFGQLARWQPGATVTYPSPKREPLPPPDAEFESERTDAGEHVVHAMDPRIDERLSDVLSGICLGESDGLVLPSFKHISRNLQKLYRVTETVLSNGGRIQTANVRLTAGRVSWRSRLAYYNRFPAEVPGVGRNHPCPCGSGRKFKRCHGAQV
jgi:hypothetical protein